MNKIYGLCGLSGCGKSTLAKAICNMVWIPFITSYTTRPMRPGEVNGEDYHFIDNEQWDSLIKTSSLVATQEFHVATGDTWRYGILKDDLKKSCIMVLTPSGISNLKELGYDVTSIYIDINESTRLERITSRNDNQTEAEIKRRSNEDKKIFKDFEPDYIVNNNGDFYDTALDIIELMD